MNKPLDHAAEAEKCYRYAHGIDGPEPTGSPRAQLVMTQALVHATLAVAAEQRTANLIAWQAFRTNQILSSGSIPTEAGWADLRKSSEQIKDALR